MNRAGPMRTGVLGLLVLIVSACSAEVPSQSPMPSCPTSAPSTGEVSNILADAHTAVVTTNKGAFTIELYGDSAPIATANFVALARCGFYTGITFHRVIADFVIQSGDPQTRADRGDFAGLGTGGPGYLFPIESPDPALNYDAYVVAMANSAPRVPDSNGSQFFIDLADLDGQLSRSYTIFGRVVDGMATVDAIGALPTSRSDVPLDPAVILGIEIPPSATASPAG